MYSADRQAVISILFDDSDVDVRGPGSVDVALQDVTNM